MSQGDVYRESAWTKARPWQPHPEWWSSTDPQSTEIEVSEMVYGMVRGLQPDYVLETGTCVGQTAWFIGQALRYNEHGMLDTLEVNHDYAEAARQRVQGMNVTVAEIPSLEFTPDRPVDFLWLDSLFELRVQEFERFRPWMHAGTVVGFHDTAPHHGPMGDEVMAIAGTRALRFRTPRGVTFVQLDD